jgi:nicotinamidase-related amidase
MKTALLIVDMQNDYFPGGKIELEGSVEASLKAKALLTAFREKRWPVVHVQHMSVRKGAGFFVPGTAGAEIHENVLPVAGETVFEKHFPNSFRGTSLVGHLQTNGIERLVIAGMMTHMCIDATTRAAWDLGFSCLVAHDACATKSLSFLGQTVPAAQVHHAFLAALTGMYARTPSAAEILASSL